MKKRVVVTGLGAVTPVGLDVGTSWQAVLRGESGAARVTRFNPEKYGLNVYIACEVKNFTLENKIVPKGINPKSLPLNSMYALQAAFEAVEMANLTDDTDLSFRRGCILGTGIGAFEEFEKNHQALLEGGYAKVKPLFLPFSLPSATGGLISIRHKLRGPIYNVSTACASGTHAIGEAMKIIQNGRADVMLCGGVESSITPLCTAGFAKVFTLSRRNDDPSTASRPFSRDRDGFVQGEGAGILLLESLEHAQQRGANIICELVGYSLSADAEHITTGNPKIWCQTMREALKDSNIIPETIDYVNAHGTSTEINDKTEIEAIKMAFGSYAKNLSVSSTKGSTGHCLPAAGGLEAVFTAMVIKNKIVPPSANLSEVGDDCTGVRHIQTAENAEIEYAMSNSFGFGGFNAVIIMKRYCED